MTLPFASIVGTVGLFLVTGAPYSRLDPVVGTTVPTVLEPAAEKHPQLIVFHGDPKARRYAFRDTVQNAAIVAAAPADAAAPDTTGIAKWPGLKIAVFYGGEVPALPKTAAELSALDVTKAKVRGRYYPASGKRPATIGWIHAFTGKLADIHVVPDSVLAIFKKAGLPVKITK